MSEQAKRNTPDEIRGLIELVDGQLRQAELLRNFVNERSRRSDFWPERRRTPRIPHIRDAASSNDCA